MGPSIGGFVVTDSVPGMLLLDMVSTERAGDTRRDLVRSRVAHNQRNRNQPIDFDYYKIAPSDYD